MAANLDDGEFWLPSQFLTDTFANQPQTMSFSAGKPKASLAFANQPQTLSFSAGKPKASLALANQPQNTQQNPSRDQGFGFASAAILVHNLFLNTESDSYRLKTEPHRLMSAFNSLEIGPASTSTAINTNTKSGSNRLQQPTPNLSIKLFSNHCLQARTYPQDVELEGAC